MPTISVIIPNYNNAKYLGEAIDSALSQEGIDLEIIVVDDGSTDHSQEVIESYGSLITSIYQQNAGASAARNVGWQNANSNWFKFLDADDRLLPSVLQRQMQLQVEFEKESSRVITFTDGRIIDQVGRVIYDSYYGDIPRLRCFSAAELVGRAPITPMPLFPRLAIEAVSGFNPDLRSADEYDLEVRLQFSGWNFTILNFVGYEYRMHACNNRISQRQLSEAEFQQRYDTYLYHLELAAPDLAKAADGCLEFAFATIFWSSGRYCLRCGFPQLAAMYFDKAHSLSAQMPVGNTAYRLGCKCFGLKLAEKISELSRRLKISGLR